MVAAMNNRLILRAVCTLDSEILRIRGTDCGHYAKKHPELGKIILNRLAGVIAERKQSQQQKQVTSILANGMNQSSKIEEE